MQSASAQPSPTQGSISLGEKKPVLAVFGGVGLTRRPLRELSQLINLHGDVVRDFLEHSRNVLDTVARTEATITQDGYHGFDFLHWISQSGAAPPPAIIRMPDINGPLVAVIQLAKYVAVCQRLGVLPTGLNSCFSGIAGHSVGIVAAVCVAASTDWQSFYKLAADCLVCLYHGGRAIRMAYSQGPPLPESTIAESLRRGEGVPSPMLSVTGLDRRTTEDEVDKFNRDAQHGHKLFLSLVNTPDSVVISGDPESLCSLSGRLRAKGSPNASTVPVTPLSNSGDSTTGFFTIQRAQISLQFLPVVAPMHSPLLQDAPQLARSKVQHVTLRRRQLRIPVWGWEQGDMDEDLAPRIIEAITCRPVDWCGVLSPLAGPWQVIDFGPGMRDGIARALSAARPGSNLEIYAACASDVLERDASGLADILADMSAFTDTPRRYWHARVHPRESSQAQPSTHMLSAEHDQRQPGHRFTELFGLPPILVAGMTPTTCSWEFVATIMNAGYYVELATGGYANASSLKQAIIDLTNNIKADRLITLNIIYASPQRVSWQIPLVRSLIEDGYPIGGLTVGAGVPSLEIASNWIGTLGLSHICFKPGSISDIHNVLAVARAHPYFPVVLQWTGGRGGGHHSSEDFHRPILETYAAIREHTNVVLVAGSGFGDVDGSWPYLFGDWVRNFSEPPKGLSNMPFDGILIGTAIMTAKEAKTSRAAQLAMIQAPGVEDEDWRGTSTVGAGGVISIKSEMGEQMHVIANRGTKLWKSPDETLFTLPRAKLQEALLKQKPAIIQQLNADHQKVWFGYDYSENAACDLGDMTYLDILRRLLELLRPAHHGTWIHSSYSEIFNDFLVRTLERFHENSKHPNHEPTAQLGALQKSVPQACFEYIGVEDMEYLLSLCLRSGKKPVPFILVLDEKFETHFKKDSLWQSEAVDITHHRDAGRVCILAGPVALRHCKTLDMPVADFLNGLQAGYLRRGGSDPSIALRTLHVTHRQEAASSQIGSNVIVGEQSLSIADGTAGLPNNDQWLNLVGSYLPPWGQRLFDTRMIVNKNRMYRNPVRDIFAARSDIEVRFHAVGCDLLTLSDGSQSKARLSFDSRTSTIAISLLESLTADNRRAELKMEYCFDPHHRPYAPIFHRDGAGLHHIDDDRFGRVRRFYHHVWFGQDTPPLEGSIRDTYTHPAVTITAEAVSRYSSAVDHLKLGRLPETGQERHLDELPLEYAWLYACKPALKHELLTDWDASKVLHLGCHFELINGQRPLAIGDVIDVQSSAVALKRHDAGATTELEILVRRNGVPAVRLITEFMNLGYQLGDSEYFQKPIKTAWIVSIRSESQLRALRAKVWLCATSNSVALSLGQELIFDIESERTGSISTTFGQVHIRDPSMNKSDAVIGLVKHVSDGKDGDVVLGYLQRAGRQEPALVRLPKDIDSGESEQRNLTLTIPDCSLLYAKSCGDLNPIHVSTTFARFAGLDSTITHGMHTHACVMQLLRDALGAGWRDGIQVAKASFTGKVAAGDVLRVSLKHVAMQEGSKVFSFTARNEATEEAIVTGEVVASPPRTAFLFTGQGSQFPGMGMNHLAGNAVCRQIWTRADGYFEHHWGKPTLSRYLQFTH